MIHRVVRVGVVAMALLAVGAGGWAWASDAGVAKTLVLSKRDVGSGYTASKTSSDSSNFLQIAACVGQPLSNRVVAAHANGPEFTDKKTGATIESSVDILTTTAMADADRAVVSDPKFASCLASTAKAALASSGVTTATAQRVDVKSYGSFSIAFEAQLMVSQNGQSLQVTVVQVYIQKGRADVSASFLVQGTTPFSQAKAQTMLDKLNTRLKKVKL